MHCSRHLAAAIFSVVSSDTALHEHQGLRYFAEKKILRDFQGQMRGKIGRYRGIFVGEKSKFAEQSADFAGF